MGSGSIFEDKEGKRCIDDNYYNYSTSTCPTWEKLRWLQFTSADSVLFHL